LTATPGGPNERADDPHRLARLLLAGGDGPPTLWFWRGEFHRYAGGRYRPVPDADLRAEVTAAVRAEFVRLNGRAVAAHRAGPNRADPPPTVARVTVKLVGDVANALKGVTLLPAAVGAPAWVGGCTGPPPSEVVPFPDGLLHLPAFAAGRADAFAPPTAGFFGPSVLGFPFAADPAPPAEWLRFLG
jgi:putative DNA primase/helicase